jgi:endonuclease I
MYVRYEGGTHGVTNQQEIDLVLTNNRDLIEVTTSSPAYMGLLDVLLTWHQQDPVDAKEQSRNDAIYIYQGNRNPFVDHPEWVDCLFEGNCIEDDRIFFDGFEKTAISIEGG